MIQLDNICLTFGTRAIFDHISCSLQPGQRIGLVGRNGSGKTTLLKVIAGLQALDSGKVAIPKDFRCAYMPQEVVLVSSKTVINEALAIFPQLAELLDDLDRLEHKNATSGLDEKDFEHYSTVQHNLFEARYESTKARAEKMLVGLGFTLKQLEAPVSSLSVGWKMRLVLAKLLLQDADFYLFDEPTNHLDLFAKDWFFDFLSNASFGFLLVSHDEYFLNNACSHICEVSMGKLTMYTGAYALYLQQKEANKLLLEKKHLEQQKFIKKQQETIDRFRAKASKASMAQSMIKALEKIELIQVEPEVKSIHFSLPPTQKTGRIVLEAKNVDFAFGGNQIFQGASFQIFKGHKVALVAPNGVGKTTLLNVITGKYIAQSGEISLGHNVKVALFEQDQNISLKATNTILDEVEGVCKTQETRARVRGLLGAFLFSGDDVYKKIAVLSGGEKNRVAMVKILLQDANLLILDEPTNHLDIVSKEILLKALTQFDGTILFVSHDRAFLNALATDIIELTPKGTFPYAGNYDEYLYAKKHSTGSTVEAKHAVVKRAAQPSVILPSNQSHELKKQLQKTVKKIESLEKEKVLIVRQFEDVAFGSNEYHDAVARLGKIESELKKYSELWEQLEAQNGAATDK